jgi:hypothetical protein
VLVFKLQSDPDTFDCLTYPGDDYLKFLDRFDGTPIPDPERPVRVEVLNVGVHGDYPYLATHVAVLSHRAWTVLEPVCAGNVQTVPLKAGKERYVALNVFAVPDCVDLDASELTRRSSGRVRSITKYVFHPGCAEGRNIFKVPETAFGDVLVSERFKCVVEEHKLTGFVFVPAS